MDLKYDIHLSAYQISKETISKVEALGFQRDKFINNTRCEVTAYHGTYRGKVILPNLNLWNSICQILDSDSLFSGGLEEEEFNADATICFDGYGHENKVFLPTIDTEQPAPNVYKACDIHINIDVEKSNPDCLKYLETLQVASFDKPRDGKIHRIFTITTETLEDGQQVFFFLSDYLKNLKGLSGKIKLEKTLKFFRKPATAYALPLTNRKAFQDWLKKLQTVYV